MDASDLELNCEKEECSKSKFHERAHISSLPVLRINYIKNIVANRKNVQQNEIKCGGFNKNNRKNV